MGPRFKKVIIGFLILIIPVGLIIKRAIAIDMNKKVIYTISMGKPLYDLDKAIRSINLAKRLAPRYYGNYTTMAQVLESQKKYRQAIVEYQKATDLRNNYAEGFVAIGMIYEKLGKADSALIFYNLSLDSYNFRIKKSSTDTENLFSEKLNRAFVYGLLKDTANSKSEFRQLKAEYPEYYDMIEQIDTLHKDNYRLIIDNKLIEN